MDIDKEAVKKTVKNWRFWVVIIPVAISLLTQLTLESFAGIFRLAHRIFERSAHYVSYNKPINRILKWALNNQ